MSSPDVFDVFTVFQRVMPAAVVEYLERRMGQRRRRGIYATSVVLWLMILQRLHGRGTLASSVEQVASGLAEPLLKDCKRVRERRISLRTGGYCQARRKLPKPLVERVYEEMLERLRADFSENWLGLWVPVFLLDGSSLQLEASRELVKAYPPGRNQHGANHWPVLKIVVFHDVGSGLAEKPVWGPMYGDEAVSEQKLASEAIQRLPEGAVVMADANFGIFWVAWESLQAGHPVLLRLTASRARRLCRSITQAGEYPVLWKPSPYERKQHGYKEQSAVVAGRLIVARIGGKPGSGCTCSPLCHCRKRRWSVCMAAAGTSKPICGPSRPRSACTT
jgi:hypothetical protein